MDVSIGMLYFVGMKKYLVFLSLVLFLGTAVFSQAQLVRKRYPYTRINPDCPWCESAPVRDELIYLPVNSNLARLAAPADPDLIGDLLWLRTCYYFGAHALTDDEFYYLSFLLDLISDLSPRWELPYVFGAVALPLESDAADEALYLIEKGIRHNPHLWNLQFFKGYIFWQFKKDSIQAAEAFFRASLVKGAPKYLASLSATLATRAGERELAKRFLALALERIEDPFQQEMLLKKLEGLITNE